MKSKKGSILGSPLEILLAFIIIVVTSIIFFSLFNYETEQRKIVIEEAEYTISDDLFLLNILKSDADYNGKTSFSDILVSYYLKEDAAKQTAIKKHMNEIMEKLFSKKICWSLEISGKSIEELDKCYSLTRDESVNANINILGRSRQIYRVEFNTK